MNALLAVVPKDGFPRAESDVRWLTGCTDGRAWVEDVRLVTVNDNTFVVLWQARDADGVMGDLCWAVFDGRGRQQGDTRTMADVSLPTGNVAVVGDTLMWVRPERCGTGAGTGWAPTRNLAVCTLRVDVNGATGGERPTLTLSRDAMTLSVGEQRLLGFDTSAPEGSYTLDFYTDDYGVAFIYPDGTVEGVGPGTATLTAALRYGGRTYTDTCVVTVE